MTFLIKLCKERFLERNEHMEKIIGVFSELTESQLKAQTKAKIREDYPTLEE